MRTLKRDQFVLKVLAAKKVTIEEVLAMTDKEVQELNLSRTIINAVQEYRTRGGVTAEQLADQIADIMEKPTTTVIPEIVDAYEIEKEAVEVPKVETELVVEEQQEVVAVVEDPIESAIAEPVPVVINEDVTKIINEVVEATTLTKEELEVFASEFTDKKIPSLTKKVKTKIGDKDFDLNVLREVVKAQVKVNKGK